ncbi:LysR family transcriptional regulator [Glycomyces tritici]|uniref:LysR substrate-binding domain-containing protein n=1 Tax=Glycomyces tritici TaxID=2665176 RepID=A0ABT7YN21_9ACTN|nr:LysR substrate-binding domain-containing protein [Glycomyces tritici]MDN3239985.1 LysR substrate-binding domain-containing protein [Glycomyces tritici]
MDLNALHQFLAVAREEHLSRAAAELRVAQPALSRTIARLEAELGAPLFDRAGRLRLNATGAVFRDYVERALGELEAGRRAVAEVVSGGPGSVRLASETFLPLTGPIAAFTAAHPEVEVRLHQMAPHEMEQALRANEVDLCLASQPVSAPRITSAVVHVDQVWLAAPQGHRLAAEPRVTIEDLAAEPFVITRPGQWQRRLLDWLFADRNLEPRIVCEIDEPAATYMLVSAGLGLSIFPQIARFAMPEPGVAWVGIDHPHCNRTLSLHWASDERLPAAARLMRAQISAWDWDQRLAG